MIDNKIIKIPLIQELIDENNQLKAELAGQGNRGESTFDTTDATVSVQGSSDLIRYTITGGKLLGITPDIDARSLIISIDAVSDGLLTITIPRSLLDAKSGNNDDVFFVLINGESVNFDETTSYSDRTLTISFPLGTNEIEIVGTYVFSAEPYIQPPITVTTDKTSYETGDVIRISGEVHEILSGVQVEIQIFEPRFGNQVAIETAKVLSDKTYSSVQEAGGGLWKSDGTYTIRVLYGSEARSAETTFWFEP